MLAITMTSERIGHWTKTRRSLARFSGPESLVHTRSLTDFITTTSGFRFSVHTADAADQALLQPAQDSLGVEELDDAELDCCRPLSTDRGAATVELTRLNLARRLSSAVFP